ncbi:MAG: hypothetical protein AAGJ40_02685 [Planctomycetota bacterium]
MTKPLTLYELDTCSPFVYSFYAPSFEVAGVCAFLLSPMFNARSPDGDCTPGLCKWLKWLDDRGIDDNWLREHRTEIALAFESVRAIHPTFRERVDPSLEQTEGELRRYREDAIAECPASIAARAYAAAKQIREAIERDQTNSEEVAS